MEQDRLGGAVRAMRRGEDRKEVGEWQVAGSR